MGAVQVYVAARQYRCKSSHCVCWHDREVGVWIEPERGYEWPATWHDFRARVARNMDLPVESVALYERAFGPLTRRPMERDGGTEVSYDAPYPVEHGRLYAVERTRE